jgi:hypothetical protein
MPSRRTPRFLAIAAFITALVFATIAPVQASDAPVDLISGGKPPAGWIANPDAYSNLFGPLNEGAPQGTIVADSGFRPYANGFPIPNWGSGEDFINTQLIYGAPSRLSFDAYRADDVTPPHGLNALSLRRTFGDGVCRDPKAIDPKTGECELLFGAELLAQMIEGAALGGHCYGFAAAAQALYNGQLPANQVGASGLGVNAANPMGNPAVQTITRLFGTQLFNREIQNLNRASTSPTEVVNTLIRDLDGGTVPYILSIFNEEGGHSITPFAVLDRGAGIYDIAVYDNNFPMRARAVTVDTNADSFTYTSGLNPSSPGITWDSATTGRITLIPISKSLGIQPCPVCVGPDQGTLVTISSLNADNADQITFTLLDEKGEPLDESKYQIFSPLNPPTQQQVTQPVITVEPGINFGFVVQTGELASKQALEVYAISNGAAQYVLFDEMVSNSNSLFGIGRSDGSLFVSSAPSSPRILQLSDQPGVSFDVNGHPLNLPAGVLVEQQWNTSTERIKYSSNAKKALRWNIQIGALDNTGGQEYVGLNVRVPAGGSIVVNYAKASATVPPRAWIRAADGDREPITLQPVTEQLINEYRDELYLAQGPN